MNNITSQNIFLSAPRLFRYLSITLLHLYRLLWNVILNFTSRFHNFSSSVSFSTYNNLASSSRTTFPHLSSLFPRIKASTATPHPSLMPINSHPPIGSSTPYFSRLYDNQISRKTLLCCYSVRFCKREMAR